MLKKLNYHLNMIIRSFVACTIGLSISQYMDYRKYPALYAMRAEPWYTSIIVYCGVTIIVVLVCVVIKIIAKQKMK